MPENTPITPEPSLTVNTPPQPIAPVVTSVTPEPSPTKKSNALLWMVILAVVTILALGGAYLYTQGYFGTAAETTLAPTDDSTETATVDAELASTETELSALDADLAQFESESSTF